MTPGVSHQCPVLDRVKSIRNQITARDTLLTSRPAPSSEQSQGQGGSLKTGLELKPKSNVDQEAGVLRRAREVGVDGKDGRVVPGGDVALENGRRYRRRQLQRVAGMELRRQVGNDHHRAK